MSSVAIKIGSSTSLVVETVLWENADPTVAFATQTIPVTQSVKDFDYIRVYWRFQHNATSELRSGYFDMDVAQYDTFNVDHNNLRYFIGDENPSGTNYMRSVYFDVDSITFGTAKQYNSTTTTNTHAIPEKVCGISKKEVVIPSKGNETVKVLWTNPSPNSAMANSTAINLSDGLENYDFIRVLWKSKTADSVDVNSWADWNIGNDPSRFSTENNNEGIVLGGRPDGETVYVRTIVMRSTQAPFNEMGTGNGSRIANNTTNSSYVIPLVICGVNIVDTAKSRISKDISVLTTDWYSTTVVFAGEDCYYAEYDISNYDGHTPTINITSSTDEISIDSQNAYISWKWATVDDTTNKLRLYATEVPGADFEIHVEGVE